jgi:DNA-binding TFAR19-related protein (PDSD5 family)
MARKRRIQKPEGQTQQWHTARKRMRGEGVFYDEPKSETIQAALTPTAKARLKQLAALNKLSVSEYLERWLREVDGLILPKLQ